MPYDAAVPVLIDGARVRVVFYGPDVDKVEDETQSQDVAQWARGKVAQLNTPRAKNPIQLGVPIDLTPPTPPDPPAPTLEQIYLRDRAIVLRDTDDISAGIADAGDATAAAHLATARASRAAYVGK